MSVSVYDQVLGQPHVVDMLRRASDAAHVESDHIDAMTHAWLVVGPPGSGRSVAGLAFAAALVCPNGGCGTCIDCRNVADDLHPDVDHVVPDERFYKVADAEALVMRSAGSPRRARWHVIEVEDFDRFQLAAVPKLLKTIEEPPPHTVWVLCGPSVADIPQTIVSRCRVVQLDTPSATALQDELVSRFGADRTAAEYAVRVSQGHMGVARALATDSQTRRRRESVMRIPGSLRTLGSAFDAARSIVDVVDADVEAAASVLDQRDETAARVAAGDGAEGVKSLQRNLKRDLKELGFHFKRRRDRMRFDHFDRVLSDLTGYLRDVMVIQTGADVPLINIEVQDDIERFAAATDLQATLRQVEAIRQTRDHLFANATPITAFEALFTVLRDVSCAVPLRQTRGS